LDVSGNSVFRGFASLFYAPLNNGPQFAFQNQASPSAASWRFGVTGATNGTTFLISDAANSTLPFEIEQATPSNTVYLQKTGRVGIGTNTPANKLTVIGAIQSANPGGGFVFPDNSVQATAATVTALTAGTGVSINTSAGNATVSVNPTYLNGNYAPLSGATFTGTVNAPTLTSSGAVNAASVSSSGAVSGGSVTTTGTVSAGSVSVTNGVTAGSVSAGSVSASALLSSVGANAGVTVLNSGTGVVNGAISSLETSNASGSAAIVGQDGSTNTNNSVVSYGVQGTSSNPFGVGVYGYVTSTPSSGVGGQGVWGRTVGNGNGVLGESDGSSGFTNGVYGITFSPTGEGVVGVLNATSTAKSGGAGGLFINAGGGDILLGANALPPLTGTTRVFRVDHTGVVYGASFQTSGADFAEQFNVAGAKSTYEPGDVLMIDETGTRRLALSDEAYSTKVAGVFATKPGVLAAPYGIDDPRRDEGVPLAVVGVVPCKVSAENGPIHAGDLLVTSSRPGVAMKGTDRMRMLGAIVGKALGSLNDGTGVIEVLVSLH